jgi:pimeloyl-ACP methyl ester carboxylesterase
MDIVLVHGAYHGPWCWERFTPELEALGYRVRAADLPVSTVGAGSEAYADAVEAAMDGLDAPVLLAHSMGGLVTPLVAARRPVSALVFVAAFLPQPTTSANEQREQEGIDPLVSPSVSDWTDLGDGLWRIGPETATELFYHDAEPELAAWAAAQLRPQWYGVFEEETPLTAWPDVPAHVIGCGADRAINTDWVLGAARERLGVRPHLVPGGHSPYLTQPADLARLVDDLLHAREPESLID